MYWSRAYANIIFELNAPGGVKLDLLQGLSHDIVGLSLASLGRLDGSGLVQISLVVDIKLAEGICQTEYVVLLKLRKLPMSIAKWSDRDTLLLGQYRS